MEKNKGKNELKVYVEKHCSGERREDGKNERRDLSSVKEEYKRDKGKRNK